MKILLRLSAARSGFLLLALACAHPVSVIAEENALSAALPSVTSLGKTEECSSKQLNVLSSIGLGDMACTISKYISFDSIGKAIGVSAFQPNSRSNPLSPSDNVEDFVRYSPRFFTRLNELYLKDTDRMTYGFLYKHFLTNSTRLFYMNAKDLRDHKRLDALTMSQYKKVINDSKELFSSSIAQCKKTQAAMVKTFGANDNYTNTFKECGKSATASLFWYRRQLDGSGDALFMLLDSILKTQDQEFYSQFNLVSRNNIPATSAKAAH